MKRASILQAACALASLLTLAACTGDELADGNGTSLPEGMYPLNFTVAKDDATPRTRVTEDPNDSRNMLWTPNTDKIGVRIGDDGTEGIYTVTAADGSSVTAETQAYWQNSSQAYVYGWYPATTDGLPESGSNIDLQDQSSSYLQFDFMAAKTQNAVDYKSANISLPFEHQMAKVNITLTAKYGLDLTNAQVYVYGQTTCSFNQGTVTGQGAMGDIKSYYDANGTYKAMIVPYSQALSATDNYFVKIIPSSGDTYYYRIEAKPEAGNSYDYAITVDDPKPLSITDGSGNPVDADNINTDVTVTGIGSTPLIITGDCAVILEDATIVRIDDNKDASVITVKEGKKLTLKVKGDNRLETVKDGGGIALEKDASVEIIGTDQNIENNKLVVDTYKSNENASIGAKARVKCGGITIKDITLTVVGPAGGQSGGAAIGSGYRGSFSDIIIDNSIIDATSGINAAAIGFGRLYYGTFEGGNITIKGEKTQITALLKGAGTIGAGIGFGHCSADPYSQMTATLGKIIFEDITTEEALDAFVEKWTFEWWYGSSSDYKIGRSPTAMDPANKTITFGGIYLGTYTSGEPNYPDYYKQK
ncbi:fimbrillin family protein [Parabacteroides sp.]